MQKENGEMSTDYKEKLIEIQLEEPEDFLKIRETLERIGISNTKTKTLVQTCHILHKRGKYYVVHFKELLRLDGKEVNLTDEDIQRRDEIIHLLENWGLLKALDKVKEYQEKTNLFVLPWKERFNGWRLRSKYKFGQVRSTIEENVKRVSDEVNQTINIKEKLFGKKSE